jgi:hypothetical protein
LRAARRAEHQHTSRPAGKRQKIASSGSYRRSFAKVTAAAFVLNRLPLAMRAALANADPAARGPFAV